MNDCDQVVVRVWNHDPFGKHPEREFLGTAFLISPQHLLTARHVVEGKDSRDIYLIGSPWNGVRRIGKVRKKESVDIALLHLEEPLKKFTPFIHPDEEGNKGLEQGREVTVVGYGHASEDLVVEKHQMKTYHGGYHLYVGHTALSKGMSGGPVFSGGKLVGMTVARDEERTKMYILPLDTFRQLFNLLSSAGRHGPMTLAVDRVNKARGEFVKKVSEEVGKILNHGHLVSFNNELCSELGISASLSVHSLAMELCGSTPELIIRILNRAAKKTLENDDVEKKESIALSALKVFGWLVLLSVKDEWVEKSKNALIGNGGQFDLTVSVSTEAALEVIFSRLNQLPADYSLDLLESESIDIRGKKNIDCLLPESGFSTDNRALELTKKIWTLVFKKKAPDSFTEGEIKELSKTLSLLREDDGKVYHITISEEGSADCRQEIRTVCSMLQKQFPALWFVSIGIRGGEDVLLLYEHDLRALIRKFLKLIKKYL